MKPIITLYIISLTFTTTENKSDFQDYTTKKKLVYLFPHFLFIHKYNYSFNQMYINKWKPFLYTPSSNTFSNEFNIYLNL